MFCLLTPFAAPLVERDSETRQWCLLASRRVVRSHIGFYSTYSPFTGPRSLCMRVQGLSNNENVSNWDGAVR